MLVQLSESVSVNPDEVIRVDDTAMMRGSQVYMRDGTISKVGDTVTNITNKLNNATTTQENE